MSWKLAVHQCMFKHFFYIILKTTEADSQKFTSWYWILDKCWTPSFWNPGTSFYNTSSYFSVFWLMSNLRQYDWIGNRFHLYTRLKIKLYITSCISHEKHEFLKNVDLKIELIQKSTLIKPILICCNTNWLKFKCKRLTCIQFEPTGREREIT